MIADGIKKKIGSANLITLIPAHQIEPFSQIAL